MNWKLLISAMLLLVLIPVSAVGLSCEVTCGLASITANHYQRSRPATANASKSMGMSQMDCGSMHHGHHAVASNIPSHCAFTSQSCDDGSCAPDYSWLVEPQSSIHQPELSWPSMLDVAIPPSGASIIAPFFSPTSLPPPPHRSFAVLRI